MPQAGRQQQTWSPTSSKTLQGTDTCYMTMGGVYVLSMYVCEYTFMATSIVIGGTEASMPEEPQSAVQQIADLMSASCTQHGSS